MNDDRNDRPKRQGFEGRRAPPRRDEPRDGKPREFKPKGDRPREFGSKDAGARGFGPKSAGAKSFGTKSFGTKSFGAKSFGSKGDRRPRREEEAAPETTGVRIAKRLARAGIASRRDAEALIADGRVAVNGRVLDSPAFNVMPGDRITLDGNEIPPVERTRLFLFHKPAGLVTTNRDPEGRRTVFDALPADLPRLMTVGRLDINTEGLLLLTNDGGLARVLELPTTGWLRRYRVRVHGTVDETALASLREGIAVDGVFYGAIEASLDREQGSNAWLTLGLREGKNREVKNVLGALGLDVNRLIRISYGPFQLGELPEGAVQELRGRMLRDQLGERLIEEAGADFDAPVVNPFSNKPVVAGEEPAETARPRNPGENKRKAETRRREDALDRLGTRPERGERFGASDKPFSKDRPFSKDKPFSKGKPGGRGGKDEERRYEPPRSRASNVWMASGARPQGKPKAPEDTETAAPRAERPARRPRELGTETGAGRRDRDRAAGTPAERGERPDWKKPRAERDGGSGGSQERRSRSAGRPEGRSDERPRRADGERPRFQHRSDSGHEGDRKPSSKGPRPQREGAERPRFDRPRSERPATDRPNRERQVGDRPRYEPRERPARSDGERQEARKPFRPREPRPDQDRERTGGDRPFRGKPGAAPAGARSSSGRPNSDRPREYKPRGERPFDAKPRGDRPYGDKPRSDRPYGEKSRADRPNNDRPRSDRPKTDRPAGGKPFGGKPGGAPRTSGAPRSPRPPRKPRDG